MSKANASGLDPGQIQMFVFVEYISQTEVIESLFAREATLQLGLILGFGLGFAMITQDLPNLDKLEY